MEAGESSSSSDDYAKSCYVKEELSTSFDYGWYGEAKKESSGESIYMVEDSPVKTESWRESIYFLEDLPAKMESSRESIYIPEDQFMKMESEGVFAGESMPFSETDIRRDSIFVYSSPSQFPDILRARESAFGSIFVRTSLRKRRRSGHDQKPQMESQFNMMPWQMSSFDRDHDRLTSKSSVFRAFERRGIASFSSNTSQWDVYPITKSALFSFHIHDRIHQTRNIAKIEECIANASVQFLKFKHTWPTESTWTGHWDGLGMAGTGTYVFPHDVCYLGKMQDGMCHDDDATLVYPNGFKALHCKYTNGELMDYQFQFPDNLKHEKQNWKYCQTPDRRFWSEIQNGLKPGKFAQRTQEDPPRKIPDGCYDTNDGFYDPKTKMLSATTGELLRVPTCTEEKWIRDNCRRGFRISTGFRPDLYENWYDHDEELIDSLMKMKKMYEKGDITYEELYRFYGDAGILSTSSPFSKRKRSSELVYQKKKNPAMECCIGLYRLKKVYEGRDHTEKTKLDTSSPVKKKPPKKCFASKPKTNPLPESSSGRIKFSKGVSSPTDTSDTPPGRNYYRRKLGQQPSLGTSDESDTSLDHRELVVKGIISEIVDGIVLAERERHRDRFIRTQKLGNLPFGVREEKQRCIQVLEELYRSIPETEEFCDSVADRTCDLKKLAEDKFQTLRYWGSRIFTLSFDENQ